MAQRLIHSLHPSSSSGFKCYQGQNNIWSSQEKLVFILRYLINSRLNGPVFERSTTSKPQKDFNNQTIYCRFSLFEKLISTLAELARSEIYFNRKHLDAAKSSQVKSSQSSQPHPTNKFSIQVIKTGAGLVQSEPRIFPVFCFV